MRPIFSGAQIQSSESPQIGIQNSSDRHSRELLRASATNGRSRPCSIHPGFPRITPSASATPQDSLSQHSPVARAAPSGGHDPQITTMATWLPALLVAVTGIALVEDYSSPRSYAPIPERCVALGVGSRSCWKSWPRRTALT